MFWNGGAAMIGDSGKRDLDDGQKAAVECDRNAVVSAGAGSGKTRVLARRYLRLVREERAGVEGILTLTFTRKAAAEMYGRIYGLLRGPGAGARERSEAEKFDRASISTIDGFSASILRGTSNRYGIPPTFSLDDDAARELVRRSSLRFLLEYQERSSLRYLVRKNGFGNVLEGFADLAAGYLTAGIPKDFPGMHRRQMDYLTAALRDAAEGLSTAAGDIVSIPISADKKGAQAETVRSAQAAIRGLGDLTALAGEETRREELRRAAALLADLKKPGGKASDPDILAFKERIDILREKAAALDSLAETLDCRGLLEDLFSVLSEFQSRVEEDKRAAGVLSFSDCAELAVLSLAEDPGLRAHYKRKYRAVMIDEFQDNNRLQKDLLYLLAEREDRCASGIPRPEDLDPEKLFFVGDEKQSIYRFRGADVRVFKGLAAELARSGGKDLRLDTNYRSEPRLIGFFNDLFSRVMAGGGESDLEARFVPLSARDEPNPIDSFVSIFCKPYREEREEGLLENDDAEALYLARRIRDWVESRSLPVRDERTGEPRPAEYGDFALLMRSTSSQIRYERIFRHHEIPYATSGMRSLFLEAPVNDLYNLLQCLVYPRDRMAYAALLRSPFVNLSDDIVIGLLLRNLPPFDSGDLPIPPAESAKFELGRELYRRAADAADRVPVPALLSLLWYEGGYRFHVLRNPDNHPYLELYEYLREFALRVPGETLAGFLDRVRPNLGIYERIPDLEIRRDEAEGVKILTIHGSKGLEFPVVIVANAGNTGRRTGAGSAIFHPTSEYGLSCSLGGKGEKHNHFFELGKKEEEAGELAELKRLLYVACTRARSHLVISGCFTRNNRGADKSLLSMVFGALELSPDDPETSSCGFCGFEVIPDGKESVLYGTRDREKRVRLDAARGLYDREPRVRLVPRTEYSATELQALLGPGPEAWAAAGAAGPAGVGDGVDAWFGSLCHKIIEELLRGGTDAAEGGSAQAGIRARRPLETDCPLPGRYDAFLEEALELARGFFRSAFARELFAAASAEDGGRPEAEVPFTAKLRGEDIIVNGVMDLVFRPPEKTVVVDFKTDRVAAPENHAVQMALYRGAAAEIWGMPAETWLYYLRTGEAAQSAEPLPPLRAGGLPGSA